MEPQAPGHVSEACPWLWPQRGASSVPRFTLSGARSAQLQKKLSSWLSKNASSKVSREIVELIIEECFE